MTGGPGRDESAEQRADRLWNDMLQEVRVSQTGAQILFGFLLGVAFTPRFAALGGFDKDLYVAARLITTGLALVLSVTLMAWFFIAWLLLPYTVLRRAERGKQRR